MKIKTYLLIASSMVCVSLTSFSQDSKKVEKRAESSFYKEDFKTALPLYREVLGLDRGNNNAKYKAELCSLLVVEYRDRPLDNILGYSATQGRRDKFFNYWLGRIYMLRYDFDNAIDRWDGFLKMKVYKSRDITTETRSFLQAAKNAKAWYEKAQQYKVESLGDELNTENSELTPSLITTANKLIYASRNHSSGELQILTASKDNDKWYDVRQFSIFGKLENSNIDIDYLENNRLIIKNGNNRLDFINNQNGTWSRPESYDFKLSNGKQKSHFAVNASESRVIFSQMEKAGDLNLYESTKSGRSWSKPKPLNNINTGYNEDSPYLSPDGNTLYFSSEGHDAIGGFDIMFSTFNGSNWSKPVNMGYPINTIDNELHFSITNDGNSGYLSSDRMGGQGGYDIYSFEKIEEQIPPTVVEETVVPEPIATVEIPIEATAEIAAPILEPKKDAKAILRNIYFKFGSSQLADGSQQELENLLNFLKINSGLVLEIAGHTDGIGTENFNLQLSQRRAETIKKRLIREGIDSNRITAKGYGESKPLASNDDELEGRILNRRIEVTVID